MDIYIQKLNNYYHNYHTKKIGGRLIPLIIKNGKIDKQLIENYLIDIYQSKKYSTYKTYYSFFGSFLNKLKKDSLVKFTITDINLPKVREREQIIPSLLKRIEKDDLDIILGLLKSQKRLKYYYFILLLSQTGLRTQEAKDLNISLKNRLEIQDDFSIYYILGKGNKYRQIYIPTSLVLEIQKNLGDTPFKDIKFPTMFIKRFAIKHKIRSFTPHQIRSYYGTTLLEKNHMPINIVSQLLGHSSIDTTAKYYLRNKVDTQKLNL